MHKPDSLKKLFTFCKTTEERYELIISLGQKLPPMNPLHKTPENLVDGCQSNLYFHSTLTDGKLFFEANSDALISKGLAAMLLHLYNGETPEYLLKYPPHILSELSLFASLSPTRATGLRSLYTRMQKIALQCLV